MESNDDGVRHSYTLFRQCCLEHYTYRTIRRFSVFARPSGDVIGSLDAPAAIFTAITTSRCW
jgi:hypothetical protein